MLNNFDKIRFYDFKEHKLLYGQVADDDIWFNVKINGIDVNVTIGFLLNHDVRFEANMLVCQRKIAGKIENIYEKDIIIIENLETKEMEEVEVGRYGDIILPDGYDFEDTSIRYLPLMTIPFEKKYKFCGQEEVTVYDDIKLEK